MGLFQWFKRLFVRAPQGPDGVSPFPPDTGPLRLIILRHSEKSGDRRDPHLSLPGRRRAEQLVDYIPATFGKPDFLIAARTSTRSRRPVETLEPLAAASSLEIRSKFDDNEIAALVEALGDKKRYRGKLGVISWRHSQLPQLLEALGASSESYPQSWDEDDYTTIIEVAYPGNSAATTKRVKMPF